MELAPDLLFDYPIIGDLVDFLKEKFAFSHDDSGEQKQQNQSRDKIAVLIADMFYELTNIREVDPDVELTAQGLDSLSGTQFISQLEKQLKIEIDSDILFEYPLYDQLVDRIHASVLK